MAECGNTPVTGRMIRHHDCSRSSLFCHRVTGINARLERAVIFFRFAPFLSVIAHFAVRRIGDVVKRFLPTDREGIALDERAFHKEIKYRDGGKCAFYQNGSTATTNG